MKLEQTERERIIELLWAMNVCVQALNDENLCEVWWSYGVPNGCNNLDEVREMYWSSEEDDEDLVQESEEIFLLFARIMRTATAIAKLRTVFCI